jgi:hypothetical protein
VKFHLPTYISRCMLLNSQETDAGHDESNSEIQFPLSVP